MTASVERQVRTPDDEMRRGVLTTEPTPPSIRVIAGGDVMFGRYKGHKLRVCCSETPFAGVRHLLSDADLTLINLETALSDVDPPSLFRLPLPKRDLRFRGGTHYARALADAGIDVAVLANNHSEDCGTAGLIHTVDALRLAGVKPVGASADRDPFETVWVRRDGVRIAIIAATTRRNRGVPRPGEVIPVAFGDRHQLAAVIPPAVQRALALGADFVIVSLHWGLEFSPNPNRGQRELARTIVDSGAALVVGHHAHVLQPVEAYRDGLILYNIGNLVFDIRQIEGRLTALFEIELRPRKEDGRWVPAQLVVKPVLLPGRRHGPVPAEGAYADRVLDTLERGSARRHATILRRKDGRSRWRASDRSVETSERR